MTHELTKLLAGLKDAATYGVTLRLWKDDLVLLDDHLRRLTQDEWKSNSNWIDRSSFDHVWAERNAAKDELAKAKARIDGWTTIASSHQELARIYDGWVDAQAERDQLRAALEKAEKLMIQWRILAQEMTPGGSEYMEPEGVREYFHLFKSEAHRAKLDRVKLRADLEKAKAERDAIEQQAQTAYRVTTAELNAALQTVAAKQVIIERHCRDWAEDDTAIKAICARYGIKDEDAPGYFKSRVECVVELSARTNSLTRALKIAREALDRISRRWSGDAEQAMDAAVLTVKDCRCALALLDKELKTSHTAEAPAS